MATLGIATLKTALDQTGLKSGLNDAKKTTKAELQYMAKSFATDIGIPASALSAAGAAATGVGIGLAAVAAAAKGAEMAYKGLVLPAQQYALAMGDLARRAQVSTEEASRWNEVAEASRVELTSLATGFRFLTAAGIQPTIANVGKLADQFLAIKDPVARMTFAAKNFGAKAGPEMAKLLELGSAGLNRYADGLRDGMVVTAEMEQKAKDLYAAQDELNDAVDEFKVVVGGAFIPAATDVISFATRIADAFEEALGAPFLQRGLVFGAAMRDSRDQMNYTGDYARELQRNLNLLPPAIGGTTEGLEKYTAQAALTAAAEEYLHNGLTKTYTDFMNQYRAAKQAEQQLKLVMQLMEIADGMTAEMRIDLSTNWGPGFVPSPTELAAGKPSGNIVKVYDQDKKKWYWHNLDTGTYTPAQHGFQGVVPSGFPNDSFVFGASSGEDVTIRTKEQQASGGGGGPSVGTVIINDRMEAQAFKQRFYDVLRG